MKTTLHFIGVLLAGLFMPHLVFSQEFSAISPKQLDEKINLEYAISGEVIGQNFNVTPYYSVDAGKSFVQMKEAKGNKGADVFGGRNLLIVWDAKTETKLDDAQFVFKLVGEAKSLVVVQDDFKDVVFKLVSLHRNKDGKVELVLDITNKGAMRDLKMINGLITITDFDKRKYDAMRGQLADVKAPERYSTPQRTLKNGETVKASFVFDYAPADLKRIMRLDIGVELITDEKFGIDLKIGKLQFRDLPISTSQTVAVESVKTKKFEITSKQVSFLIKKEIADNTPPQITVTQPTNVVLTDNKATRGRPYGQSTIHMEDKRRRSLSTGAEFATLETTITVKGTATDASGIYAVSLNGVQVPVEANGQFSAVVPLQIGKNEIVIRAVDLKTNSTEAKFFVLRKNESGKVVKGETEELDLVFDKPTAPKYYALIMGANDYADPNITDLAKPIEDATKIAQVLVSKYTFDPNNVFFIKNPTREQMINHLDHLSRKMTKNDNLLIFFAGHGFWDEDTDFGYWIPTDSKSTSTANWMANSQIKDYVAAIKSKHTLLIADACFGGSIFRSRKTFDGGSVAPKQAFDAPSRKAMTSGNLTEVPDKSVFLQQLVDRLSSNTKDYITAEEIFGSIRNVVMSSSPVTPVYGEIRDAGDEGGDFVFVKK